MSDTVRRVVTGYDENGKAVVTFDGPAVVKSSPARPWVTINNVWMTDAAPAPIDSGPGMGADMGEKIAGLEPPAGGTVCRIVEFRNESPYMAEMDEGRAKAAFEEMNAGHAAQGGAGAAHAHLHRTETVDYAIVLSGEVYLVLDDSEVLLKAGDVCVQRGTNHAWSNRSEVPARIAFILIDGKA